MTAMLDLATLDTTALCDQGAELELTHPVTGMPLGIWLTLAGMDSIRWRNAVASLAERRLARRDKMSSEDYRSNGIELLARCTLSWRGVVLEGQELSCSEANARRLYERFPWIYEQADRFASDRGSYLRD